MPARTTKSNLRNPTLLQSESAGNNHQHASTNSYQICDMPVGPLKKPSLYISSEAVWRTVPWNPRGICLHLLAPVLTTPKTNFWRGQKSRPGPASMRDLGSTNLTDTTFETISELDPGSLDCCGLQDRSGTVLGITRVGLGRYGVILHASEPNS